MGDPEMWWADGPDAEWYIELANEQADDLKGLTSERSN